MSPVWTMNEGFAGMAAIRPMASLQRAAGIGIDRLGEADVAVADLQERRGCRRLGRRFAEQADGVGPHAARKGQTTPVPAQERALQQPTSGTVRWRCAAGAPSSSRFMAFTCLVQNETGGPDCLFPSPAENLLLRRREIGRGAWPSRSSTTVTLPYCAAGRPHLRQTCGCSRSGSSHCAISAGAARDWRPRPSQMAAASLPTRRDGLWPRLAEPRDLPCSAHANAPACNSSRWVSVRLKSRPGWASPRGPATSTSSMPAIGCASASGSRPSPAPSNSA